ncbi:MAG: hypothetical protein HY580_03755 [Nitrospinae bacterium]|nr:hypothetical protein [Nitrospinota bacterium]
MNLIRIHVVLAISLLGFASPDGVARSAENLRNPFALPEGVILRSLLPPEKKPEAKKEQRLVLEAITMIDGKKIVSINKQNFELGDSVFEKKLVEIGPDYAVLEDGEGKTTLTLRRRAFSIHVTQE